MTTFLLVLLTIIASSGAGWVYGWLTGEQANDATGTDPFSEAWQAWSDISVDVQRAEE